MSKLKDLLEDVSSRSIAYREASEGRHVAPDAKALANLDAFYEELSEQGASESDTIAMLDELGSPAAVSMTGPRYFGFVIGGSMPVTLAANWLASAWDQNAAMHEVTPAVAILEQVSINWMTDLLGLPENVGAAFVTGATVASFTSLAAARNKVLQQAGWDVRADGLFGAPEITVFVGAEAHPTLMKALSMLGLGERRVTCIDVDNQGRLRAEQLHAVEGPCIVCAQAGNINTGAFDPINEICDRIGDNTWVHIDGAFGLWAAASPELRHLCAGLERADSWATDAHKWLNVPYDSGIAFVRDESALKSAMAITAEYLPTDSDFRNPADYTPELSRRARGVDVWAALRTLGRNGIAEMIERCCRHAQRFGDELTTAGFNVLNDVVLNQVLVAFGDDETTLKVVDALQKEGTCWCGSTVWQGRAAMRISVTNWSTRDDDVTASIEVMIRLAKEIA
jgi:glutamate/tyrosine decarboxylase-like PLP-dependent enzyme